MILRPLVQPYHHLLDHTARLAVQVGQLRILRLDEPGVQFGMMRQNVWPPLMRFDMGSAPGSA